MLSFRVEYLEEGFSPDIFDYCLHVTSEQFTLVKCRLNSLQCFLRDLNVILRYVKEAAMIFGRATAAVKFWK